MPYPDRPIKFLDDTPTKPKPTGPSSGDSEPAGSQAGDYVWWAGGIVLVRWGGG